MFGERPKHLKHLKHLKDWARAQANCFKCLQCFKCLEGFKCLGRGPWLEPETNLLSFFNVLNVVNDWASPHIFKTFIHLQHLKPLGP